MTETKAYTMEHLPFELLDKIIVLLGAGSIDSISRTSKSMRDYVKASGWRAYVRDQFPGYILPEILTPTSPAGIPEYQMDYRDIARSQTKLAHDWMCRSLQARKIQPSGDVVHLISRPRDAQGQPHSAGKMDQDFVTTERRPAWKPPKGQTIGFKPALDSYEIMTGGEWSARREVLVASAGASLLMRMKERQSRNAKSHHQRWTVYRPPGAMEGRDDVTCVQAIRSRPVGQGDGQDAQQVIVGTASGRLQSWSLQSRSSRGSHPVVRSWYDTGRRSVRALSLVPEQQDIAATILGNDTLAIYNVRRESGASPLTQPLEVKPSSELHLLDGNGSSQQAWSCKFVNSSNIAVTYSNHPQPVGIFTLRPEGPSLESRFSFHADKIGGQPCTTSYAVDALTGTDGRILCSGGYDGIVRIHDTRVKRCSQYIANDDLYYGAIYSLLPRPEHYILAGASGPEALKAIDMRTMRWLRIPGEAEESGLRGDEAELVPGFSSRQYDYDPQHDELSGVTQVQPWKKSDRPHVQYRSHATLFREERNTEGTVYNLTSPSSHSPFVYLGVSSRVLELAVYGSQDQNLDPIVAEYRNGMFKQEDRDAKREDRKRRSVDLGLLNLSTVTSIPPHKFPQGLVPAHRIVQQVGMQKVRGLGAGRTAQWSDVRWQTTRTQ